MRPEDFKDRISDLEDPNQLDLIREDLEHLIEQTEEATDYRISFGHYSNELEEEVTQLDEAQAQFNYRMDEHKEDLKRMRDMVERKMDRL